MTRNCILVSTRRDRSWGASGGLAYLVGQDGNGVGMGAFHEHTEDEQGIVSNKQLRHPDSPPPPPAHAAGVFNQQVHTLACRIYPNQFSHTPHSASNVNIPQPKLPSF